MIPLGAWLLLFTGLLHGVAANSNMDLFNITWINKLDSPEALAAYLKGPHRMALESIVMAVRGNDSACVMGKSLEGRLTLIELMQELFKYNEGLEKAKIKGIKINIPQIEAFEQMKSDLTSTGAPDWLTIHFDYFKGPAGGRPTLNPKTFKTQVLGAVPGEAIVSLGMALGKGTEYGYTAQDLMDFATDWKLHGFNMLDTKVDFAVSVIHLMFTDDEILKRVNEDLKEVNHIEMRLPPSDTKLALTKLPVFRTFINRIGISRTYFNVPAEFREAYLLDDKDVEADAGEGHNTGSGAEGAYPFFSGRIGIFLALAIIQCGVRIKDCLI